MWHKYRRSESFTVKETCQESSLKHKPLLVYFTLDKSLNLTFSMFTWCSSKLLSPPPPPPFFFKCQFQDTCNQGIMLHYLKYIQGVWRRFLNTKSSQLKQHSLGPSANQWNRLQKIKNAAALIVTRTKSREHITPVRRSLHWLPVTKRIEYKILCLTYLMCMIPVSYTHLTLPTKLSV